LLQMWKRGPHQPRVRRTGRQLTYQYEDDASEQKKIHSTQTQASRGSTSRGGW